MHIEIVLGRVVLAREEGGPKHSAWTKPAVSEDYVAPEVVPTDEAVDGHYPADTFGLPSRTPTLGAALTSACWSGGFTAAPSRGRQRPQARPSEGRETPTGTPGPGAESPGG